MKTNSAISKTTVATSTNNSAPVPVVKFNVSSTGVVSVKPSDVVGTSAAKRQFAALELIRGSSSDQR